MENVDALAKIIWDYLRLNQKLKKSDCILALGTHDTRIADRAVDLYFQGYAPYVVFSGGTGRLTQEIFHKPEAEIFADIAFKRSVTKEKIFIENQSANTGENIEFTKNFLNKKGLHPDSFIVVQKPYMERRSYATFKKLWPEKEVIVTSPQLDYEVYFNEQLPKDLVINIMVGDLQRIKEYSNKGFQIYQEIPDSVWDAYEKLVELGYDKHLIKD